MGHFAVPSRGGFVQRITTCVAGLLVLALGGTVRAQSLDSELAGLLTSHPQILAQMRNTEAAEQGVRKAFAGYLPKLDIYGQSGPQYIDSPVLKSEGGGTWLSIADMAGTRLTQNVFNGFATPAQVRSARLSREASEFTLQSTRQNVLFDGIDAYLEVLRQSRLVALAGESERTIRRQLHLEDERVQRGAGIAVDVLQAKSRLQVAMERRIGFEEGLADSTTRYIEVFGHPPLPSAMTEPMPPVELLPATLEQALAAARQDNPAIDSSLAGVAVAEQGKRLARAGYYPSLDVIAAANRQNDTDLVRGTRTDASVLLSATWNLFDGFATTAATKQAAAEYKAAQQNHDIVARDVARQAHLAWSEWATARQRVTLLENAAATAAEVFDARQKLREAGRETVINVLDAENEVYTARINLVQASGDASRAVYRLLQSMGRLGPEELGLAP